MLKSIATDDVWLNVTWQGTRTKSSFITGLSTIRKAIADVAAQIFKECDVTFCDAKIKSFLRHTEERVRRQLKGAVAINP